MNERFLPFLNTYVSVFSPLEEQVARLGTCAKCHTKTLAHRITNQLGKCMQCTKCYRVYILPDSAKDDTNPWVKVSPAEDM